MQVSEAIDAADQLRVHLLGRLLPHRVVRGLTGNFRIQIAFDPKSPDTLFLAATSRGDRPGFAAESMPLAPTRDALGGGGVVDWPSIEWQGTEAHS